ncbi:sensor histidine kinase [Quadrisphaera sp. INWT6]|uniref:sensor histidine kinase n=1 Tax=Quadrisphaera sp. INWT6 TaxID=2596917 RepID=UPI002103AD61|nr:sensor histidine kinase [Quadrisphaera sp. INWT6]
MTRVRAMSLARQLLALQAGLLVLLLLGVAVLDAVLDVRSDQRAAGERVLGIAEAIALSPVVAEAAGGEAADPGSATAALQPFAEAVRGEAQVSFITIMAPDGTRWTHPRPEEIGRTYLGSREQALAGRPFTETYTGTLGPSVRAVVPVFEDAPGDAPESAPAGDGARPVVALVAVGVTTAQLDQEFVRSLPVPLAALGGLVLVALAGSALVSRRLRRQTHGMGSEEMERMYSSHEAVLHSVREGLVVVDPSGRVGVANDEGRRLLGLADDADDPVGRPAADLPVAPSLRDLLVDGRTATDETHLTDERVLVVSQSQVPWDGNRRGAVMTLRDRTELEELTGELDSTRALSEALRSQAHEAANRLHAVVVLVETGHPERAVEHAVEQLELSQRLTDRVVESIEEPVVAAVLLGKTAQAAERAVTVQVEPGSYLPAGLASSASAGRDLVTVLGNLLDNAVDAVGALDDDEREVLVGVRPDGGDLLLRVSDSGPGLPDDLVDAAFTRGWTTKVSASTAGRGLGLSLVDQVVRRRRGTIDVTGSTFEVRLPLEGLR